MKLGNKVYLPMQIETKTYQICKGVQSWRIHYITQGNRLTIEECFDTYDLVTLINR